MDSIPNSSELKYSIPHEIFWESVDKEVAMNFTFGQKLLTNAPVNCIKIYTLTNEDQACTYKRHFDEVFNLKGYDVMVHYEFEVVGSTFNPCIRNKKYNFFVCPTRK